MSLTFGVAMVTWGYLLSYLLSHPLSLIARYFYLIPTFRLNFCISASPCHSPVLSPRIDRSLKTSHQIPPYWQIRRDQMRDLGQAEVSSFQGFPTVALLI